MPIEGRGRHLDPKQIPKDNDIHLVEFKFCSDVIPQQTLEKAHNSINPLSSVYEQGASETFLEATKPHFKLYFLELGAQPTISSYPITLLLNLGVPTHKVHLLATKLHCHAIKSLNKITKTRHKIHLKNNSNNGGFDGEVLVERLASGGLDAGRIAWLTTRRILISLCSFSFFSFLVGLWLVVSTCWEPLSFAFTYFYRCNYNWIWWPPRGVHVTNNKGIAVTMCSNSWCDLGLHLRAGRKQLRCTGQQVPIIRNLMLTPSRMIEVCLIPGSECACKQLLPEQCFCAHR